eukprot:1696860-Alexandrium_andersonii.AAC.1
MSASLVGSEMCIRDRCRVGLRGEAFHTPMRKPTRLAGTAHFLLDEVRGERCVCTTPHQIIQGVEGGMRRSAWA